jgi:hypothetical protein
LPPFIVKKEMDNLIKMKGENEIFNDEFEA